MLRTILAISVVALASSLVAADRTTEAGEASIQGELVSSSSLSTWHYFSIHPGVDGGWGAQSPLHDADAFHKVACVPRPIAITQPSKWAIYNVC
ncbi:hypothetical protein BDZ97DRAFT_456136 [Flammula alnicola]|nr:hypothetical protein BDZ97DRAFT_456136 [Flammula alnicola]